MSWISLFEFCDNCGSIMLPSKDSEEYVLVCTICDKKKVISEEIEESYTFNKEIEHHRGREI